MSVLISFITTKLWIALIPAAVVGAICLAIIVSRRRSRDPLWLGAMVTLPVMIGKLLLVWTLEPLVLLVPPIGVMLRGISGFALLPEGLVFIRMLDAKSRSGEPWLQAASLTIPFGSIVIGALAAVLYKKIREEK